MTVEILLETFQKTKSISDEMVLAICSDEQTRKDLVGYFKQNQNRPFVLALLNRFIELRKSPEGEVYIEDLMLVCLLLGMHRQIEDCLKIWEAKDTDFDTYCGVDIQLVPFMGVEQTIEYLNTQRSKEAEDALKYVRGCEKAGDFKELEEYYNTPWFL